MYTCNDKAATDAQGQQSSDDYAENVDSTCTSVSEIHSFFQQVGQDVSHSEIEDWLRIDNQLRR